MRAVRPPTFNPCGRMVGARAALAAVLLAAGPAQAQIKPCEALRDDIATRMNVGAGSYRLEIADADADVPGQVVGRCEGGRRKIVYIRTGAATTPSSEAGTTATLPTATPTAPTTPAVPRARPAPGRAGAAEGDSPVDRWIEQLGLGTLQVNLPGTLRQGEPATLELTMQPDNAAEGLRRQINTAAARDSALPRASGAMHARVVAAQWRVAPLTPTEQNVTPGGATVWRWEVTPLAAGAQRLHLTVSALVSQGGASEPRTVRSFDKAVQVEARPGAAAGSPLAALQRYAAWAGAGAVTLLALGVGWWLGRRGRRGTR